MPKNWIEWILKQEQDEKEKQTSKEELKYRQESDQSENTENKLKSCDQSQSRASFISVDSGFQSDYDDDYDEQENAHEDDEDEEVIDYGDVKTRLRNWLKMVKSKQRPIIPPVTSSCIMKQSLRADPYDDWEMFDYEWDSWLDDEDSFHGLGTLSLDDGGWCHGAWKHGIR